MAAWAQTGKEESGARSKPFSCVVTSLYAWNENTARAPKRWANKGLPLPDSLAAKKQMPRCRVKVQLFPVIFYFQMSSACSQFPEPHNLHYKYVWTQITLSRFQEASQKLNLPSSTVPRAIISLGDHREQPFHQFARQTLQRLLNRPGMFVAFCGNMWGKVMARRAQPVSRGEVSTMQPTASLLLDQGLCAFSHIRLHCWGNKRLEIKEVSSHCIILALGMQFEATPYFSSAKTALKSVSLI